MPYEKSIRFLFAATIFTSSFLLFLIQPMMGKYILPLFGGSASVWTTAMLFFMTMLLLGYLYAHVLAHFRPRTAFVLHTSVILSGIFILWVHTEAWGTALFQSVEGMGVAPTHPMGSILFILLSSIGIQYFALSATSSLLQSWYARVSRKEPFWLYALSNVASLFAIAAYPFFIEPLFPLRGQSTFWYGGFVLYGVFAFSSMALFLFVLPKEMSKNVFSFSFLTRVPIEKGRGLSWLGYSTLGALLLLVFTTYATRMVASVPFLWLLPLSLYLISFVLTFSGGRFYKKEFFACTTAGLVLGVATMIPLSAHVGTFLELLVLHLALFSSLVFCHGELYARRPEPSALTFFYLVISVGGVLAGLFATVLAPLIFNRYLEFHITLFILLISVFWEMLSRKKILLSGAVIAFILVIALTANRFGPSVHLRNFYGVLTIFTKNTPWGEIRGITNGTTLHGMQFTSKEKDKPLSYYGKSSGVGIALEQYRERKGLSKDQGIRVGVIGLGAGTLAAYGEKNDSFVFYEINPAVTSFAQEYFTYLHDSRAQVSFREGDARMLLEQEQKKSDERYDVLVLDAFSDDSVPVHLLTREAFELYLSRLSDKGVLAVHISSRYLDLSSVISANAEKYGLSGAVVYSQGDNDGVLPAVWVVLSKDDVLMKKLTLLSGDNAKPLPKKHVLWTDNYSNLFSILR